MKKVYSIGVTCNNCGKKCKVLIPKGMSVKEAALDKVLKCDYCGVLIVPKEYSTEFFK